MKQTTQNNYKRILRCDIYYAPVVTDCILYNHRRSPSSKNIRSVTHSNVMKTTAGLRMVRWFTHQMTVENYHAEKFEGVILVLCLTLSVTVKITVALRLNIS